MAPVSDAQARFRTQTPRPKFRDPPTAGNRANFSAFLSDHGIGRTRIPAVRRYRRHA